MIDDSAVCMGRAITAAREDRGMERGDLADRAGVSHPYLGELEQGRRSGTPMVLERIASALAVTPAELHSAAAAIASGAPPSYPPTFLYDGAAQAAKADSTIDVRQRTGQRASAGPTVQLRPLAPRAQVDEDAIVQTLTTRIRSEVQRWLDTELEPAVRAEVRRQRSPEV
jgi:transcriptional regulator with XRE-family HTH domain